MATIIQVEKPKEVWHEIRRLIDDTSQNRKESFSKTYPALYSLYLAISAHGQEFKFYIEGRKDKGGWE